MSWKNIFRKADASLEQSNPRLKQILREIKTLKTEMNSATNANRRNNLNSQIQAKSQEAKAIQTQSNRKATWKETLQNNPNQPIQTVIRQPQQPQQTQTQQTPQPPQPEEALTTNQKRQKQRRENLINRGKEQARREDVVRNEQAVQANLPSNQRVVSGSNRDRLMEQIRIRQQRENEQRAKKQAKIDAKAQKRQAKIDAKAQAKQAKKDARKNPNIAPRKLVSGQEAKDIQDNRLSNLRPKQGVLDNPNSRLRPKQNQSFSLGGK
mgnify:CR=1 FL=1|jgi:hypothetical protein